MQRLFSSGGFNAHRDIAGIVLNRWGHALISPPPGFFFGVDGKPGPRDVIRERFGRISFGHSELGWGTWESATLEGKRAISQVLQVL
jgi:spermidine dehydrogenase